MYLDEEVFFMFKNSNCEKKKCKKQKRSNETIFKSIKKNKVLYFFLLPAVILTLVFSYLPLPWLVISFMDYDMFAGFESPWVGLENIKAVFTIPEFAASIKNTVYLSILNIIFGTPLPIIFALMLNELKNGYFKRFTQTVSYLPHFLSTIAVIGLATSIFSEYGIINDIRVQLFGADTERVLFLALQKMFVPNVIFIGIWQSLGWNSIIYLSAISGIDSSLYEAAIIEGAGKWRQCWHITLPGISQTIILLFILSMGGLFNSNFELIYGLQNAFIDFEVISTVIYKQGITAGNYSVSTAFGFLQGLISLVLVLGTNVISKKINDVSIL